MHATNGGLCGQVLALASSNDSGEKKTRIRRSKEERKTLVESFIKMYQKSNNGNFPSLRLTHKEVGGSFYTVREIVREVIQENRVLAPPKDNEHSGLLGQHPLGSISMEPPSNFPESERAHLITDFHGGYQIMSEESIASSNSGTYDSGALYLDNEKMLQRGSKVTVDIDAHDGISHLGPSFCQGESMQEFSYGEPFPQTQIDEFMNHETLNDVTMLEENHDSDKQEANLNASDHAVDAIKVGNQTQEERDSNTVETFPLHPVSGMVQTTDGAHTSLSEEVEGLEDDVNGQEVIVHTDSNSDSHNRDDEEPRSYSVKELSGKVEDGNEMKKPHHQFQESTKRYVASDLSINGVSDSECKVSSSSSGTTPSYKGIDLLNNGNTYSLDRINLDTWEESTGKKATPPQSDNTFVALLKGLFAAFSKLWSE